MDLVIALIALLIGVALGFIIGRSQKSGAETRASMLDRQVEELKKSQREQLDAVQSGCERQVEELKKSQREQLDAVQSGCDRQVEELKKTQKEQLDAIQTSCDRQVEELKQTHKAQLAELQQQYKAQIESSVSLLREQFKTSAEQVLKQRSEELSATNREQLSQILNPLQSDLRLMKDEVVKNREERTATMTSLKSVIDTTIAQARELGERADNLANALTRDNRYQGNFGELCLSKMLEDMGFERGKHFEEQVTLRDDEGRTLLGEESDKRMMPDVILHFPDGRDIIIDSKVSMTDFERYANAKDETEKQQALKAHVQSVRNQVKLLTQKGYWKQYNQKGVKLDFVVMFMFSESALQLALSADTTLWHEAYSQGVLITGGQNLYALLRILEISWRQMAQVENQENIMQCANDIVSRVQLFYARFLDLEDKMQKVQGGFADLKTVIAPTGKSIITSANKLLSYGAKEDPKRKKALPKSTPDNDDEK